MQLLQHRFYRALVAAWILAKNLCNSGVGMFAAPCFVRELWRGLAARRRNPHRPLYIVRPANAAQAAWNAFGQAGLARQRYDPYRSG